MASGVTGEVHHVDAGYHIVGMKHPSAPDITHPGAPAITAGKTD
jgi:enoyl-[acyl-carrier protein] reductase I